MALAFLATLQWFIYFLLLLAGFSGPRYCSWMALGQPPMKVNFLTRFISNLLLTEGVCCVNDFLFVVSMIFWEKSSFFVQHTDAHTHTLTHTHTCLGACTLYVHLGLMDGPGICDGPAMIHLFIIIACGFLRLPLLHLDGSWTPPHESQFSDPFH